MSVLELDASPRGQLLTRLLIDVMADASAMVMAMVMMCDDPADIGPITDATIDWLDRLTT